MTPGELDYLLDALTRRGSDKIAAAILYHGIVTATHSKQYTEVRADLWQTCLHIVRNGKEDTE